MPYAPLACSHPRCRAPLQLRRAAADTEWYWKCLLCGRLCLINPPHAVTRDEYARVMAEEYGLTDATTVTEVMRYLRHERADEAVALRLDAAPESELNAARVPLEERRPQMPTISHLRSKYVS